MESFVVEHQRVSNPTYNQVGLELNLNDSTEKRLVREFINDIAAYRAEGLALANINREALESSAKVIDELSTPKAGDR